MHQRAVGCLGRRRHGGLQRRGASPHGACRHRHGGAGGGPRGSGQRAVAAAAAPAGERRFQNWKIKLCLKTGRQRCGAAPHGTGWQRKWWRRQQGSPQRQPLPEGRKATPECSLEVDRRECVWESGPEQRLVPLASQQQCVEKSPCTPDVKSTAAPRRAPNAVASCCEAGTVLTSFST